MSKKIALTVEVPDDVDVFTLHDELVDERPDWADTLTVYESVQALRDDAEDEDGLTEYRVTIDAAREQYVYTVDAEDEETAERHGRQLAANDGWTASAVQSVRVEVLS